jgi:hypothetical protein
MTFESSRTLGAYRWQTVGLQQISPRSVPNMLPRLKAGCSGPEYAVRTNARCVRVAATRSRENNLLGAHALVFAGDWSEAGATKAAAGAAAAGEGVWKLLDLPHTC